MYLTKPELELLQKEIEAKYFHLLNISEASINYKNNLDKVNNILKFLLSLGITNLSELRGLLDIRDNYAELEIENAHLRKALE